MCGRNGEPSRRQKTGRVIRAHAGINANAHLATQRRFDFPVDAHAHRHAHPAFLKKFFPKLKIERWPNDRFDHGPV